MSSSINELSSGATLSAYTFDSPFNAVAHAISLRSDAANVAYDQVSEYEAYLSTWLLESCSDTESLVDDLLQDIAGKFFVVVAQDKTTGRWAWRDEQHSEPLKPQFDNTQALSEGWGIFSLNRDDEPFQLQRDDEEDVFEDDDEAWAFVFQKADEGSTYHIEAMDFLKQYAPKEHEAIVQKYAPKSRPPQPQP